MAKRSFSPETTKGTEVRVPSRAQIAELVEVARLSQHLIEPLHQEVVDMAEVIRLVAAMPAPPAARQRRLKQMGAARRAMKGLADIVVQEPVEPILNKHLSRELGSSLSTQAFERTGLAVADRLSIHILKSREAQGRSGTYRALEDEATQLRTLHARKHGARVLEEVLRRVIGRVEAYLALERENKGGRPPDIHRRFVISRLAPIFPHLYGSEPKSTVTGPFVQLCQL